MGTRRARRGIVVALVLTVLSTVLAAGSSAQTPAVLRVAVIGDSVLLGAKEELLAQFAGQQVTVDAVEDRSLLGAIGLFRSAGPALGDVVVLDLGYNDSSDPAVFRGRVDDAMTALAGVRRVIWLNQHDWGPGRAGMNAELTAAASRYANLDVVDWNAEVAAHPDYVYADAIHLTATGQPAMAAAVRDHFDRYVASLTPTTTPAPSTAPVDIGRACAARRVGSHRCRGCVRFGWSRRPRARAGRGCRAPARRWGALDVRPVASERAP